VEREEKKEFNLHRELSSPLLSVDTDCNLSFNSLKLMFCSLFYYFFHSILPSAFWKKDAERSNPKINIRWNGWQFL
jgi:hypothetical protein